MLPSIAGLVVALAAALRFHVCTAARRPGRPLNTTALKSRSVSCDITDIGMLLRPG
jgi:hypothetical protein